MENASSWDLEDAGHVGVTPGWQAAVRRTNGLLAVSLKRKDGLCRLQN